MTAVDIARVHEELAWLKKNPEFAERPASLTEFLGPRYLNIEDKVRVAIRTELSAIMGEEVSGDRITKYSLAMITGGIGIGKTTVASIVLPYLAHWVLCLKDPQDHFNLLPGSRIAFMQMSTSEQQALEVVFGDIKARIEHSPWFKSHPYDPHYKKQIRFKDKDIWILPGDSSETTFEGYNILGGILDEADSHKVTPKKDYAEEGYNTISNRITSRFGDKGFLLVIGQMKKQSGFAARMYKNMKQNPKAYVVRMAIWDSMGDSYYADEHGLVEKFSYDTMRKMVIPDNVVDFLGVDDPDRIIVIPKLYLPEFQNNPEKALKDLAGIPPAVGDPFISLVDRIIEGREKWQIRHDGLPSPYNGVTKRFEDYFRQKPNTLPRVMHIDIGYASDGDAMGIALAHIPEVVEIHGERKPLIVFDALIRLSAPAGGEIFLGDMRRLIYELRDDYGYNIKTITLDGFQSQDTIQQLRKHRMHADYLSVDRQLLPYHDLREAIYEGRVEFPPLMVKMRYDSSDLTEIAIKELSELVDNGIKIDHPELGSKDVADAMAGCTYTLMGDRRFRRKVSTVSLFPQAGDVVPQLTGTEGLGAGMTHPAVISDGMHAPVPPVDSSRWRQ